MPASDDKKRRGFLVRGRVQGVGFRWWTRKTAESLGVRGSVRNRADGTVEIHAEAAPGTLESFRERLQRGPSSARVDDVSSCDSELPVPDRGFRIER